VQKIPIRLVFTSGTAKENALMTGDFREVPSMLEAFGQALRRLRA